MMRPVSKRFIYFSFQDNRYGTDQDGAWHEVRQPCAVDQVQLAQENEVRVALKRTLDPSLRLTRADT
jgi:hypothetical protein